ncbi:hypothetical protein AWM75_03365 [Aerococcus urinaehominis]|uniref:Uncharacterized protein n=1 Tax=Aerococcus urinaehominis TaxID=128944 RepID=A0A109RGL4_9LACT|nr:bile acid:sodium symporter [Aerococcus urinaehominis]AMB99098.1 hypothetical protein AWM75_03365 [Aerococcus urinaehominis]SDM03573.1 Predicted Na+-dependent transporter [Aerococcus urinaehominis]
MSTIIDFLLNIISSITDFILPIFVFLLVLNVGLSQDLSQVWQTVKKDWRYMAGLAAINYLLVPFLIHWTLPLIGAPAAIEAGFLLYFMTCGAPVSVAFIDAADNDDKFGGVVMLVMVVVMMIFLPVAMPFFIDGLSVPIGQLFANIAQSILIPLLIGLAINYFSSTTAKKIQAYIAPANSIMLDIVIYGNIIANIPQIIGLLGTGTLAYAAVMNILIMVASYFIFFRRSEGKQQIAAQMTGMRNAGISMLLASTNFQNPDVLMIIVVISSIGTVLVQFASQIFAKIDS